jgi:uncharacterized membrane protein YeaQ/YmgE (transglycosylase-associated protein family)
MTLELFVMWVVVGLAAGWLAGYFMKGGGYGLIGDIALGLVGSIVGSLVFRALGVSLGAGLVAAIVVASIGAVILIGAQRMVWAHA